MLREETLLSTIEGTTATELIALPSPSNSIPSPNSNGGHLQDNLDQIDDTHRKSSPLVAISPVITPAVHASESSASSDNVQQQETTTHATTQKEQQRDDDDFYEESLLDKATGTVWWREPGGFFYYRWLFIWYTFKTLFFPRVVKKDRARMAKKFGRDLSTYLSFQQNIIYAVLACSILACAILIPLHLTGTYPDLSGVDDSNAEVVASERLIRISVSMRIDEAGVMAAHVVLSIAFVLLFIFFCVLLFMKSSVTSELNYERADETKIKTMAFNRRIGVKNTTERAVQPFRNRLGMQGASIFSAADETSNSSIYLFSPYCLMIESVPADMDQGTFHNIVYSAVDSLNLGEKVAKIVMIPNFAKRVEKEEQILEWYHHADSVAYLMANKPKAKPTATVCCSRDEYDGSNKWRLRKKYEAGSYYNKQISRVSEELDTWDNKYRIALFNNLAATSCSNGNYGNVPESNMLEEIEIEGSGKKFKAPPGSGVGFILFTNKAARKAFLRKYRTGINISKKNINPGKNSTISSLKVWDRKTKREKMAMAGNSVKRSELVEYNLQKDSVISQVDLLGLTSMRVIKMDFEPEDLDWRSVFVRNTLSGLGKFLRTLIIYVILIFVFIFVSTPLALVTSLQDILAMGVIGLSADWVRRATGVFGAFFFQYLPTLLAVIASSILPIVIIKLTVAQKRLSHSSTQRKVEERIYFYLIMSILILPSMALVSVDGVFRYFGGTENITAMFANAFVPSSGAFFINYVLHKALLGNTLALYKIGGLIVYFLQTRFTSRIWRKTPLARFISPIERFQAAERSELELGLEYANIHLIATLVLTYCVFQPIILVCGLLYFLYKYFVDRYTILYMYSHRSKNSLYGAAFGFKKDFIAHQRSCIQNVQIIFGSLFVFTFLQTMFYATKIVADRSFIPHTAIMAVVAAICALMIPLSKIYLTRRRKRIVRKNNVKTHVLDKEIDPAEFSKAYEPVSTFSFLPKLSKTESTTI